MVPRVDINIGETRVWRLDETDQIYNPVFGAKIHIQTRKTGGGGEIAPFCAAFRLLFPGFVSQVLMWKLLHWRLEKKIKLDTPIIWKINLLHLEPPSENSSTNTWNPKAHQLKMDGCLVISNHFLCKDLESSS